MHPLPGAVTCRARIFFQLPLKPIWLSLILQVPRKCGPGALAGPEETGAGGVRSLLVPILLNGGYGYEDL